MSAKSACLPTESPIGILEDRRIFRISSHLFLEMSKVDHQNSSEKKSTLVNVTDKFRD